MTNPTPLTKEQQIRSLCDEYYANWESYDLLPDRIIEVFNQAIKQERSRVVRGLNKLKTHGLDVNIHLDEAIKVVEALKQ